MEDLIRWRRHIHRNAELSFKEYDTQRYICGVLDEYGIEYRHVAGTGVLAWIGGDRSRTVVLRADIDGLPIAETADVEFASRSGVMHACGHDMHAAALLGAMVALRKDPPAGGCVVGLFQPGEEMHPGGASVVIGEGVLDEYNIVAFVGEHCSPELATGTFGFHAGQFMASTDEIHINVRGQGGHAAQPEMLRDPVAATAELLVALRSISAPFEVDHVLAFGRVIADGATNVIPDEVYVEGTFRTFSEQWRGECKQIVCETAARIGERHRLKVDLQIKDGYPSVFNNEELTARAMAVCEERFGSGACVLIPKRMTAEDFGFYTERYPSVFFRLGVGSVSEPVQRLHTASFCPDEDALKYGAEMLEAVAREFLAD